jgi:signal transduction histidine kinase
MNVERPEAARDEASDRRPRRRIDRLIELTAALAEVRTTARLMETVVDRAARALGASTAGLWLVGEGGPSLAHAYGYEEAALRKLADATPAELSGLPVLEAARTGAPVWCESDSYATASLPLSLDHETRGVLAFTFENVAPPSDEERNILALMARCAAEVLERFALLRERKKLRRAERAAREAARAAQVEADTICRLTSAVDRAATVEQVYELSLDAIREALAIDRASILVFDEERVMRFKAWRGISEEYRRAVDRHSPWSVDARDPQPIFVEDVSRDPAMATYLPAFVAENIKSLAFIPLVRDQRLLGKFMLYFAEPRVFSPREVRLARVIADQVACAIGRMLDQHDRERLINQLSNTVRLNELFTGVLGHDLRNPLGAILMAAQLILKREEEEKDERVIRPAMRILSSGERMARMIDQLLDFTRIRVGHGLPIARGTMDLGALCRVVVDELAGAGADHRITLDLKGDFVGSWDADRLAQVVSNLVANAIEHGVPNAPIHIVGDGTAPERVVLRVTNKGGIPEDVLPILFDPFRGGKQRPERTHGLGLGLYITEQIVRGHGGTVEASVARDRDETTFTVILPR